MPALALPSPGPFYVWVLGAGRSRPESACTLPHQPLSIGSLAGGELADAFEPLAHPLGTEEIIDLVGRQRGLQLVLAPRPSQQRKAEEQLIDDEEWGGD